MKEILIRIYMSFTILFYAIILIFLSIVGLIFPIMATKYFYRLGKAILDSFTRDDIEFFKLDKY